MLTHASKKDIRGKHVVGILPPDLARHAGRYTVIPLRTTALDRAKTELTLARLRQIAGPAEDFSTQSESGWVEPRRGSWLISREGGVLRIYRVSQRRTKDGERWLSVRAFSNGRQDSTGRIEGHQLDANVYMVVSESQAREIDARRSNHWSMKGRMGRAGEADSFADNVWDELKGGAGA